MEIKIPFNVEIIINILQEKGFDTYAVGGCIRDSIIGHTPSDWDIATSALPEEVGACFDKTYATGILHGTITVVIEGAAFEVTTFRTEEGYTDFRRPDKVNFVRSLEEDLKRRDFTINAMAYNPSKGLIDLFDGVTDIKARVIRAVGDPKERFFEDALRMLRAVRFAAKLGFEIEIQTAQGIVTCANLITKISKERIREELTGILMSQNPDFIEKLYDYGVLNYILPELSKCFETPQNNPYHVFNVGRHTMEALKNSAPDFYVRWAVMLHDIGKAFTRTTDNKRIDHFHGHEKISEKIAVEVLEEYKFDNESKKIIKMLVKYHDRQILPEGKLVRRVLNDLGENTLRLLILVKRADSAGKNRKKQDKGNASLDKLESILNEIIQKNQCTSLKDLNIKGDDLISIGVPTGPVIGQIINNLLEEVINSPELNEHTLLLEKAKKLWKTM